MSKTVQQVLGGKASWRPSERVDAAAASAGRNTDASDNFLRKFDSFSGVYVEADMGYFDTDRDSATLQGDFGLGEGQLLTVGLDWLRDQRRQHDRVTTKTPARQPRRVRAVPGHVRRAVAAGQRAPRRQRAVRRPHHRQRRLGHRLRRQDWRVTARLRHRVQGADLQRAVLPPFGLPTATRTCVPEESKTWEAGPGLPRRALPPGAWTASAPTSTT